MNVTVYREPFTFIVIDNWLDGSVNQWFLDSIDAVLPYMQSSKVGVIGGSVIAPMVKSSMNLWMFQHQAAQSDSPNFTKVFEENLWSKEMREVFMNTGDSAFQQILYTNHSQLLLSKYVEGDHYGWHRDYCPTITVNYMLAKEPLKFEGGEFVFGSWDDKEARHTVDFKNNRLVVFPSRVYHKVQPVKNFIGDISESRFTLQYWSQMKERRED
jgi:Rps23 Pro-64 3,4-dihydroxylase Tpa1-like proline 4-hydroxylase